MKKFVPILITGAVVGLAALLLVAGGTPANMGFCIACFLRDTAGALGLHTAANVQYARPEIPGLILGAFLAALATREFKGRGGSAPVTRFVLGFAMMVGSLMFLGCPLRMILRLGGGDLNALVGLAGFACGILVGIAALQNGFSLRRSYVLSRSEGAVFPLIAVAVLAILGLAPSLLQFSVEGPGSMRAPALLSLACGLVVGVLAQRTRLCTVGGIRDAVLFRDFYLLMGPVAILAVTLIGNLALGSFAPGFAGQPVAHSDGLWNFLGMALVGWSAILLGGCPLRQLILAGEGNGDSAVAVLGMVVGAAFCHNFGLASSTSGPTGNGKAAVIIGFVVVAAITLANLERFRSRAAAPAKNT